MKKIKIYLCALVGATVLASCNKSSESVSEQLSGLRAVSFPEQTEQVLSSQVIGNRGSKVELLQTVRRQKTLNPVGIFDGEDAGLIYPGSILRGDSFMEGGYDPVTVTNPQEITLSVSLQGPNLPVSVKTRPVLSELRQGLNDLVNANRGLVDYNNTPTYLTYTSNQVSTLESFNKSLEIHVRASVYGGMVKGKFEYSENQQNINNNKYVLIKVKQLFYNVFVDPKPAEDWGDLSNIGEYEPVYVSSVDYGRMAYILVQTDESAEEVSRNIKASLDVKFRIADAGASMNQLTKTEKYFSENRISIKIVGGPLSKGKVVNSLDSFVDFLTMPSATELVRSAAPIGYRVRTLKDNKEVEVRAAFTEQQVVTQ